MKIRFQTVLSLLPAALLFFIMSAMGQAEIGQTGTAPEAHRLEAEIKAPIQEGEERLQLNPLQLNQLVSEMLRENPKLLAAAQQIQAARARPRRVSSLPDPRLSVISRNVKRPIPFANVGDEPMSLAGVGFTQELPFPGKLRLKGKIAGKEADAATKVHRAIALRLTAELKQAYYRLHFVHQATDILHRQQRFLDQLTRIAETRYAVGKGIQQDILRAQVEQSLLENRLTLLEQERGSLEARINRILNRHNDIPLARPADYEKPVLEHNLDELYDLARQRSPQLQRQQDLTDRNQLALRLAKKGFQPDFSLTAAYFNRGQFTSLWETRVDVKLPLYFWRKQRNGVKEASSRLFQSRQEQTATGQEILFRVKDEYLAAQASDRLVSLYGKAIVPQATLALESSLSSYEVGKVDFLTLINNFVTILDYETSYWDQHARLAESLARLEALVATPLISQRDLMQNEGER